MKKLTLFNRTIIGIKKDEIKLHYHKIYLNYNYIHLLEYLEF